MTWASDNLGRQGEASAVQFLEKNGYKILDRNYQNNTGRRLGEIDIIAKDKQENMIVFFEVKTREMEKYRDTLPEENITEKKLRRLSKIASAYLRAKHLEDAPYRFDALSVWLSRAGDRREIKHIIGL